MEVLSLLWTVLSFILGLVWQVVWFLLRDLISTALWLVVFTWLILSVRYRSFTAGARTLLRYGGFGLRLAWRQVRGTPGAPPAPPREKPSPAAKVRYRRPFGSMSISEQLNMLLVGAVYLLIYA